MRFLSSLILSLSLLAGLYLAGQQIGQGTARFRADNRSLTVKGLAEQDVKADQATWNIVFRRAGNDYAQLQAELKADKEAVQAFLTQQGFAPGEVQQQPTRTVDKLTNEYGNNQGEDKARYILTGKYTVKSKNVDQVAAAVGHLDDLQAKGLLLDTDGGANPSYALTNFNAQLRPQLLDQATLNAKGTAEQMAQKMGVKVGKLRSANQGVIQIFAADQDSEFGGESAIQKRLRVVSTFEFDLK
jgi:hypothetical protein